MTYATELVQRYRQALHTLWNTHFWAPEAFRNSASVTSFDSVKLPLFVSLVMDRLGSDLEPPAHIFGAGFTLVPLLVPAASEIPSLLVEMPKGSGVWKTMNGPVAADYLKLVPLDFFDWDLYSWRDFRYYLARIESCNVESTFEGSQALVEVAHVDVLWEPQGILGLPMTK